MLEEEEEEDPSSEAHFSSKVFSGGGGGGGPTSHLQNLARSRRPPHLQLTLQPYWKRVSWRKSRGRSGLPLRSTLTGTTEREWLHSRAPRSQWMEEEEEEVQSFGGGPTPLQFP
ncbi:unnamed protein product [Staurois parvus]|uniref:Uncharacterized protein n=1 Tax=Staurois parvus TaxID=386267 RepID=A0ABN9H0M4_9NEOB|nr:unnamed protein product [Staurois parvus]